MMEFCAVLRSYPKDVPGGAEYQAYLICRELAERGYTTHYVAYQSEETKTTNDDGIVVHRSATETSDQLLSSLREIGADVYYFRLAHDLPLLWRAKRRIDATFVYNVSRDVQCQSLFSSGPYQDSKTLLNGTFSRIRYGIYRFLLRAPDFLFAQTHQQQRLLEQNHSLQSTVIGNGHPVPDRSFEKKNPPVVLWLANVKKVKNPETFIRLVQATADLDCRFWMVGRPVDEELSKLVRETAREYEQLEYLGGCDIQESNEYFARASVYIHTGDSEGFPNTFIQSWLHEAPVLSFCTDPDDILKRHDIGAHCSSLEEAESTLRRLIQVEEHRTRIGSNAFEYGTEHHSIDAIVDRIEQQLQTTQETATT